MSRIPINLPVVGYDQPTARIASWRAAVGDVVTRGEVLADIETEKVTVELEAPAGGTLVEISADAGTEVAVGDPIGWLDDGS